MADATMKEQEGACLAFFLGAADLAVAQSVMGRLARTNAVFAQGGLGEALSWCGKHEAPAALFVDMSRESFPVAALADLASRTGPGCRIVAVGAKQDVTLYRSFLQAGAFDYLVSPLTEPMIADTVSRSDQDQWLGMPEATSVRVGRTIAVTGACGGVGTSTIVTALGRVFADRQRIQTVLVDFDRRKADLALLLGIEADNGLAGILSAAEIDYRLIQRTLLGEGDQKNAARLSLLGQQPGEETPVDPNLLLTLGGVLCELFSLSVWDIPSHRPQGSEAILANADAVVLVVDYTVSSARAAKVALLEAAHAAPEQRRFLVANRCRGWKKPVLTREQMENFLAAKIDCELPFAGSQLDATLLTGALDIAKVPEFAAGIDRLSALLTGKAPDKVRSKSEVIRAIQWLAEKLQARKSVAAGRAL